jgi:hypothetical protein
MALIVKDSVFSNNYLALMNAQKVSVYFRNVTFTDASTVVNLDEMGKGEAKLPPRPPTFHSDAKHT